MRGKSKSINGFSLQFEEVFWLQIDDFILLYILHFPNFLWSVFTEVKYSKSQACFEFFAFSYKESGQKPSMCLFYSGWEIYSGHIQQIGPVGWIYLSCSKLSEHQLLQQRIEWDKCAWMLYIVTSPKYRVCFRRPTPIALK